MRCNSILALSVVQIIVPVPAPSFWARVQPILTFSRLAPVDDFIAGLWDVHKKVKAEGYAQAWLIMSDCYGRTADVHYRTLRLGCSGPTT